MPKAIISNKIYLDTTPELMKELTKVLTYKIKVKHGGSSPFGAYTIVKNYKVLPKGVLVMPSGRADLIPAGYDIVDKRVTHELPFPNAKLPLNSEQLKIYELVTGSCIVNAKVGWGRLLPPY